MTIEKLEALRKNLTELIGEQFKEFHENGGAAQAFAVLVEARRIVDVIINRDNPSEFQRITDEQD